MLYICPKCKATYKIPDEKVKTGKRVKVKCRKCQHISFYDPEVQKKLREELQKKQVSAAKKIDIFKYWYYLKDKQKKGPFTFQDIDRFCESKIIDENTYVWHPSLDGWKIAKNVKVLKPFFERKVVSKKEEESTPPPIPEELIKEVEEAEKRGVQKKVSVHKTSNLINLLEQIEQQETKKEGITGEKSIHEAEEKTEVERKEHLSDIFVIDRKREEEEREKIVDILEKIHKKEKEKKHFKEDELNFFKKAEEEAEKAKSEEEEVLEFLKSLKEEEPEEETEEEAKKEEAVEEEEDDNIFPDDIPEVNIPDEAVVPSKEERKKLIQEFSLMIRLEKKSKKMKIVFFSVLIGVTIAIYFIITLIGEMQKKALQRGLENKSKKKIVSVLDDFKQVKYKIEKEKIEKQLANADNLSPEEKKALEIKLKAIEKRRMKKHYAYNSAGTNKKAFYNQKHHTAPQLAYTDKFEFKAKEADKDSEDKKFHKKVIKSEGKDELMVNFNLLGNEGKKPISEEEVTKALKIKMKKFLMCKRFLVVDDQIIVTLTFTIGKSGRVINAKFETDQKVPQGFYKCLYDSIKNWQFPKPGVVKTYTRQLIL